MAVDSEAALPESSAQAQAVFLVASAHFEVLCVVPLHDAGASSLAEGEIIAAMKIQLPNEVAAWLEAGAACHGSLRRARVCVTVAGHEEIRRDDHEGIVVVATIILAWLAHRIAGVATVAHGDDGILFAVELERRDVAFEIGETEAWAGWWKFGGHASASVSMSDSRLQDFGCGSWLTPAD